MHTPTPVRAAAATLVDAVTSADPGLLRAATAARIAATMLLTMAVLAASGAAPPLILVGTATAMVSSLTISDPRTLDQLRTLALAVPAVLATATLGALLTTTPLASGVVLVALVFGAVYARRFGKRATALGTLAFQAYFATQFIQATPALLTGLYAAQAIAFTAGALTRLTLAPVTGQRSAARLLRALDACLERLLHTLTTLATHPPAPGRPVNQAAARVRRDLTRLHRSTALLLTPPAGPPALPGGTSGEVQRRIVEIDLAAERLAVGTLALLGHPAPALALHLPHAPATVSAQPPPPAAGSRVTHAAAGLTTLHALVRRQPHAAKARHQHLNGAAQGADPVGEAIDDLADALTALYAGEPRPVASAPTAQGPDGQADQQHTPASPGITPGPDAAPRGLRRATTRAAAQAATGTAAALVAGNLITSGAHAYWAVLSCWTIYVGTSTTGEILVKGFRRTTGTLAGILAALAAAGLTTGHPTATMTLIVAGVLGIAATAQLSHAAMAFFVTATIALALPLLSTPTSHALTDRVLETTVGAVCGILAGHLVWPVPTAATADARLRDALTRLRQVVDAALRPGTTAPVDAARQLDQALADLRTTAQPLTYGATPWRRRRRTVHYLTGLLDICATQAKHLTTLTTVLPLTDPATRDTAARVEATLQRLITHTNPRTPLAHPAWTTPAALVVGRPTTPAPQGSDPAAQRAVRHLHRLDACLLTLADTLGLPVDTPQRQRFSAA
ncbi:FUSC family protein [Streptomyces sp. NPDC046215]|uniref:FUSC family protein n=1 Tax=Streptomyces sp. NPDC046215 TaxID=3155774 RepID=UPI0033D852FD